MKLDFSIINNRLLKIFGNIIKLLSTPFHKVFPNKRFSIPTYSKPLIRTKKSSTIPRIIWQTNFTNKVSLPVYANYLFNRFMAPKYEYRFMITGDREYYIRENYPDILTAYKKINVGAAQADLWRLLVLQQYGGIYIDIDGSLVARPEKILKNKTELFIKDKQNGFTNYFIATTPSNDKIKESIKIVLENIEKGDTSEGVFFLTGPGAMRKVLNDSNTPSQRSYRLTCIQGAFSNEHFQYIDRPNTKWHRIEKSQILKK